VTESGSDDLARRIRAGSGEALADLYRVAGPRLYALAWRLTLNRADAEDAVHDLFVGLPRALERYREGGRFEAWLRRLLVRTALMRRRGEGRRAARDAAYALEADRGGSLPVPGADGEAERLLAALPEALRAVVVLREIEGMSHAEIARALGITEVTSRVRLARGLTRLRRMLEEEGS
jgi:RNA polymerase sigma-70 factor (ECF subfamily)